MSAPPSSLKTGMDSGYHRGKESAMSSTLAGLQQQVTEDLRPETPLERIFAHEIAYATWELERVRELSNNAAAEAPLAAAYSRASRNWSRARKELQRLQTARHNHIFRVPDKLRPHYSLYPMADPGRVALIKPAAVVYSGCSTQRFDRATGAQQEEN